MNPLETRGFEVVKGLFGSADLTTLRAEADHLASASGTTCVRDLLGRSRVVRDLSISNELKSILPGGLVPVRAILFDKTEAENWPVPWHQDTTIAVKEKIEVDGYGPWSTKGGIVHVRPPAAVLAEIVAARVHLDDTPDDNGALRVIPGSFRQGRIEPSDLPSLAGDSEAVCACEAGDVLLMKPLTIHSSPRSSRPSRRRVFHIEYAPAHALDPKLEWHELRAPALP